MAFLDENGLSTLWDLIKAEDAKNAKVVVGSYVGTGTFGVNNPTSITFDRAPKLFGFLEASGRVVMNAVYSASQFPIWGAADRLPTSYANDTFLTNRTRDTWGDWLDARYVINYAKRSTDGKTISWYGADEYSGSKTTDTAKANVQRNASGVTYYYFAIM